VTLPTPSQTVGPFFNIGLPGGRPPQLVSPETEGAIRVRGVVYDGDGKVVPDALIEIWQADRSGRYEADRENDGFRGFARAETDERGGYAFVIVKPGQVRAPGGGMQAPHIAVSVFARGLLKRLATRIYFSDEQEANAADPVLRSVEPERRATVIARADGGDLLFDVRLQGQDETVFFDL
jgi:protocatechuate 3,4-dioxygenase, alpha subunit